MSSANRTSVLTSKPAQIGPVSRIREVMVTLRNNIGVLAAVGTSDPGGGSGVTLSIDVTVLFRLEPGDSLFLTNTDASGLAANVEVIEQPSASDGIADLLKTLIEKC